MKKRLKAKKNKICFSTGSFFVPGKERDINENIQKCCNLRVDGIEIMFSDSAKFLKFKLTKNNVKFLKSLKYNTIHSPLHLFWQNSNQCKKILLKLKKIYDQIEGKNIVFHAHRIKDFRLLKYNPDYQYSVETDTPGCNLKITDYKKIFKEYPHLKLVLDTSHSIEHSKKHISLFIKHFKDRITYTHLSAVWNKGFHQPLHIVKEANRRLLNPVKNLQTPVVIELIMNKPTINLFKKEISFVKKWLNQN